MKKIIFEYFYSFNTQDNNRVGGEDIVAGLMLFPVAFPLFLIKYWINS